METLTDLITLLFQALLGIGAIVSLGWFAASGTLTDQPAGLAARFDILQVGSIAFVDMETATAAGLERPIADTAEWPAVVVALTTHIASLLAGWVATKAGAATWMTESLTFNNVTSFPVLLVQILVLLSSSETALGHLRWRSLDTVQNVSRRAVEYVIINLLIVQLARTALVRFGVLSLASHHASQGQSEVSTANDDDSEADAALPASAASSDERSPLLSPRSPTHNPTKALTSPNGYIVAIFGILGLLVGLIKPLQRVVVGSNLAGASTLSDETGEEVGSPALTGLWKCFGLVLSLAGGSYAVLDMLGQGAVLRVRADKGKSTVSNQPPILGPILIITFWRYVVIPAISISIMYGFRKIDSTAAYLQDPVFSFILALSTLSPPSLPSFPSPSSAHRARIHLHTHLTSLLLCIPLSIALGTSSAPGRGVSWATDFDLSSALKRAAGGGLAGALAMVLQVLLLMPMRTVMNYQYRYGGAVRDGVGKLYADGGWRRYYAGMGAALFQGPLARFGDTAANAFILSLLASLTWPVLIKTVAASLASAAFRMVLTPIDTLKTTQQTRGGEAGWRLLGERIKKEGVQCLWWGALATAAATFVGHYPWFGTYNFLSEHLPPAHTQLSSLARQAFIGFAASVASDTISNSLRVVKTYRQVHERDVGYFTAAKEIVHLEGISALFGRGLPVRLLTNGLQGLLFSILWKRFEDGISNSGTAGWAIAISLVGALYAGALIRAVLSLGSVQAAIRRMMGRGERGAVRLEED